MKKNDYVFKGSLQGAIERIKDEEAGVKSPDPITADDILAACGGESLQATKRSTAQRGNKNALTHGVYSQDLVLPWESEEDLRDLCEALKEEHQPQGCSEEHALFTVAKFMWLQRRANNMASLQFQAGMPEACHDVPWQAILQYQRQTPERVEELTQGAKELIAEITAIAAEFRSRSMSAPTNTPEGKQAQTEYAALTAEVDRIKVHVEKKIMPAIRNLAAEAEQQTKLFSKAYDPDQIERLVAIEAAMETRIEKALARLTALKEFKKFQAPSLIPPQRPPRPAQVEKKEVNAQADVQIQLVAPDDNTSDKK
jgi:hypothetical protein